MLNIDVNHWHRVYRACREAENDGTAAEIANVIDRAACDVIAAFKAFEFGVNGSDPAERMVAGITAFFFESNPSFLAAVPTKAKLGHSDS